MHTAWTNRTPLFVLPLIIATLIDPQVVLCAKPEATSLPSDVTIGVKVWPYSRVYPLLDGLFQDVAATQVKTLLLDPNAANGTSLDALQQAFQLQAQYTATAGIQNGLAAQQASTASASALLQAQLVGRQSQLIQSQLIAQNQVGLAQKTLDGLSANKATQSDIDAAKQQLQLANDNLASVTSQLSDVKNQLAAVATPSFTPPSVTPPTNSPTLPSLTGPANVPSTFSANFPATKQMDNQMTLLWERVSRLVYTMNQTSSQDYYLVQVNTGIVPIKRKHQMLVTHYKLQCGTVIDIFPRSSAVNIINEKYRESRFGLAALVQLFSWGLNAAYNRNHLQISQMLSQSSYITGYGVGTSDFGWIYGITLGEDSISPGTRDTFVLVQADVHCGCNKRPEVEFVNAAWGKKVPATSFGTKVNEGAAAQSGAEQAATVGQTGDDDPVGPWPLGDVTGAGTSERSGMVPATSISYAPLEDDPAVSTPTAVMVAITLPNDTAIDPETTILADGVLISRIRDTFGRAVGGGGSGGVLEVSAPQLQLNTWIPVNSHELILNLNPRTFRGHFPTILMQSPRGSNALTASKATIQIQGRRCDDCRKRLPPLSYPKAPVTGISVARWMFWPKDPTKVGTGQIQYDSEALLIINAINPKTSPASQTSSGPAPLQVIDDANSNAWGSRPQVQVVRQDNDRSVFTLDCNALGPQLVCSSHRRLRRFEDKDQTEIGEKSKTAACSPQTPCMYTDKAYQIDVVDPDHSGGPFHGRGLLPACSERLGVLCSQPLIWKIDPPVWTVAGPAAPKVLQGSDGWVFHVAMINVSTGERAQLNHQEACGERPKNSSCSDLNQNFVCPGDGKICSVTFALRRNALPSYSDSMDLKVFPEKAPKMNTEVRPIKIGGLRSQINPILTSISSDSTRLTGSNLVFPQIVVGADGKPIDMTCSPPTDCDITYPPATKKGFLYFVAQSGQGESGLIPVELQGAQGLTKILYTPPDKTGKQPSVAGTTAPEQPLQKKPLSSLTE